VNLAISKLRPPGRGEPKRSILNAEFFYERNEFRDIEEETKSWYDVAVRGGNAEKKNKIPPAWRTGLLSPVKNGPRQFSKVDPLA